MKILEVSLHREGNTIYAYGNDGTLWASGSGRNSTLIDVGWQAAKANFDAVRVDGAAEVMNVKDLQDL